MRAQRRLTSHSIYLWFPEINGDVQYLDRNSKCGSEIPGLDTKVTRYALFPPSLPTIILILHEHTIWTWTRSAPQSRAAVF